jgi:hypothetical protein
MSEKTEPKLRLRSHANCGWYSVYHEKDEEGFDYITLKSPLSTLKIHSAKGGRRQLANREKLAHAYFESEYAEVEKAIPLPNA